MMIFKLIRHYFQLVYWSHQSLNKVKKMQLRKFRELFEYAREHSKFYHDLYAREGVLDLSIQSWEDVEKVPIVTKQMLRNYKTEDIVTEPINEKKHNIHSTSGSSGNPFKIVYDKWIDYSGHIRLIWLMMKHGYTPFKTITLLSRYNVDTKFEVEQDLGIIHQLQSKLHFFQKNVISIFETPSDIIKQLENQQPYVLWTTPSAILLVAQELERRNERLNIPLLLLMSETYTSSDVELFKRRICINYEDDYGCMELPTMGESFNQNEYKSLIPNFVMAEVQNIRELHGERVGDYIVTNLVNRTMPFIRYDLGDYVGVIDDPDFPTKKIGKVYGRCDDIIEYQGVKIYFHQIYQMFMDFHYADQFKLYQHKNGEVEFQIKLKEGASFEAAREDALIRWNKYFPEVPITVASKEVLPINPKTGKFKVLEKEG